MMAAPLLQVQGLRVAFGGKEVVRGVDFAIAQGEKLALVGESGSGKTVTALSLLGLVQNAQVTGSARFAADPGRPARDLLALPERELLAVRGREIAMIFQEPMTALNPLYTVGDQIAEVLQLKEGLNARQAWQGAVDALASCGIPDPQRRAAAYPHQLSGGQRQRAMIAMALSGRPRLLLADEPTTALDVTLRGQILDLLTEVQQHNGMAILLITHDLNLVRKFADRVAVMENGHLVEQGPVAQVFAAPQHPYTRKLIDSRPERDVAEAPATGQAPVMRASGLQVSYPVHLPGVRGWFRKGRFVAVRDAAFSIGPGRTLGVVGEGLLVHEPALPLPARRERVVQALAEVGLAEDQFPGLLQRYPHEFSGGQRQRLAIARALIVGPQLLVLDEPTSALDVTIQKQVLRLLQRLQRDKGLSYLLITHDVDVIRAMAHDVVVMKDGDILESGPVRQVLDAPRQEYTRVLVAAAA